MTTGHSVEDIGIPYKRAYGLSSYALTYVALTASEELQALHPVVELAVVARAVCPARLVLGEDGAVLT